MPSASSLGKSEDTRSASPKGLDKIENEGYLLASSAMRENRKNEISVTSMQIKGKLLEEAILPFISPSLLGKQGMNAQYGSLAPQIEVKVSGPEGPGINKLVLMEDLLPRLGETGPCDPLGAATLTGVPSVPEPILSKNNSYSIDAALLHYDFQSTTFLAPLPGLSLDTSGITKIQEGKSDDLSTATFDLPHSGGNRGGEEQLTSPSEEESFMPCFGLSRDYSFQEESYED